jgi:hypothetical protein
MSIAQAFYLTPDHFLQQCGAVMAAEQSAEDLQLRRRKRAAAAMRDLIIAERFD